MLNDEVVDAVTNKKFHIYPIATVDEAMAILTGRLAGKRGKKGNFPRNSVNYKVDRNLLIFSDESIEDKSKK